MAHGYKSGGRKKGTPNKDTSEKKQRIELVLSMLDETIENDLYKIGPIERVKIWATLQEFIRPKLARTTISGDVNVSTIFETTKYSIKSGE